MKSRLFSDSELKQVESKVREAELRTSGEIVVLVVRSSGEYRWVRFMWGAIGAAAASIFLWLLQREAHWGFSLSQILEGQLCGALLFSLFPLWQPLKRASLSKSTAAETVHRECLANFTALGLHETRDRTGVLVYLSELERRVQILADKGIHEKVGHHYWKDQVAAIVLGIRTGRTTEAVCDTVTEMGRKLSEHFPRRADDTDELSNEVRLGRQGDLPNEDR